MRFRVPPGDHELSGHGRHLVEPEKFFQVYSGQREHRTPGSNAKKSGLHMQAVMGMLCAGDSVFAGHEWQPSFACVVLYVLGKQGRQSVACSPENPGKHIHSPTACVVLYRVVEPGGHQVQSADPTVSLYLPIGQAVHS